MKDKIEKEAPKRGLRSTLPLSSFLDTSDKKQIRETLDELIEKVANEKCGPQPLILTKSQWKWLRNYYLKLGYYVDVDGWTLIKIKE